MSKEKRYLPPSPRIQQLLDQDPQDHVPRDDLDPLDPSASVVRALRSVTAGLSLSPLQSQFIALRCHYPSDAATARALGLAAITIRKWRHEDPAYKQAEKNFKSLPWDEIYAGMFLPLRGQIYASAVRLMSRHEDPRAMRDGAELAMRELGEWQRPAPLTADAETLDAIRRHTQAMDAYRQGVSESGEEGKNKDHLLPDGFPAAARASVLEGEWAPGTSGEQ